jgi:hypothetical protein
MTPPPLPPGHFMLSDEQKRQPLPDRARYWDHYTEDWLLSGFVGLSAPGDNHYCAPIPTSSETKGGDELCRTIHCATTTVDATVGAAEGHHVLNVRSNRPAVGPNPADGATPPDPAAQELDRLRKENAALTVTLDTFGKHHKGIQDSRNDYAKNYYAAKVEIVKLRKERDAALARASELESRGQWQPIETAPDYVDGIELERLLVYSTDFGVTIGKVCKWQDGTITKRVEGQCGEWNITHFMPLPQPPTGKEVR